MRAGTILIAVALSGWLVPAQTPPAAPPRFVVVLDPAHGGDDTGGRLVGGEFEKAATLAFSIRLRSLLNARGIPVVTTREADIPLDPDRRAAIANHVRAQACLSLHVSESGSGVHLFTSSLAPTQPSRFTAWKTAQSGWITRSLALAGAVNSALQQTGTNVTLSRTDLLGVDSMTCPAIAIELAPARGADGSVTGEPDDPEYQSRIAATLANALLERRMEGRQP
jgi:N-acetylmuramoyl-L-alanine amidase